MVSFSRKKVLSGISGMLSHMGIMKSSSYNYRKKIGLPPGSLIYTGEQKQEQVKITLVDYDAEQYEVKEPATIEECLPFKNKPTTTWINIDGLHAVDVIESLKSHFNLHSLALEDCLNTAQRPKVEQYEDFVLVILKMLSLSEETGLYQVEQVSFFLGENFVVSLQEQEGDVFKSVRNRLFENKGRIRKRGADYLLCALLDAVVDHYFIITEHVASQLERIDQEIIDDPPPEKLQEIYQLKNTIISIRRLIAPLREAIRELKGGEQILFVQEETEPFFRDVFDHLYQIVDTIDLYRDMLGGMLDLYLSMLGHKTNEVMKVLTIIATIFIPITFIAGIYGMNFEYMPELKWRYGYFAVWGAVFATTAAMLLFFRRKKWI